MTTNGINPTTRTVHTAKTRSGQLIQACPMQSTQRATLDATTAAVTCKRCAKAAPVKKAPAARPARTASTGPAMWGVFEGDTLVTFRDTRKAALLAADGRDVRKI